MRLVTQLSQTLNNLIRRNLDRLGIVISTLCALHCFATVGIVAGIGLGSSFLLSEQIHQISLLAAMAVAAVAIGWGMRFHGSKEPLLLAVSGLACMASALVLDSDLQEAILTIAGVALVCLGHVRNMRASRSPH